MNRKKAILLWSCLEAMLMTMLLVCFLSEAISLNAFFATCVALLLASSAAVFVITRKFPN